MHHHHADPSGAVTITVDGAPHVVRPRPGESLLEVLRDRLGVTTVKDGCRPQGQCGACAALVDGHVRVTCTLARRAGGRRGRHDARGPAGGGAGSARAGLHRRGRGSMRVLPARDRAPRERARRKAPEPSKAEIERALDLHLCRCTGYAPFVRAIDLYAREKRGEARAEPAMEGGVGASVARSSSRELALGERDFVADLSRPGLLHGAVRMSDHARAKIVRIDTTKALAMPGVVAVVTAEDVPGQRFYGLLEQDWPGFVAIGEEARAVGDVLAAVAAEDEATARAAAALVEVEYDVREPLVDPEKALRFGRAAGQPAFAAELDSSEPARPLRAAPGRRRGRARPRCPRRARDVPDPAHRAPLSGAGVRARRALARRTITAFLARPRRVRRQAPGRVFPRPAGGSGRGRARAERRRLRRQGGSQHSGARGAARAKDGAARAARALPRTVHLHAPEAPRDAARVRARLRRERHARRAARPHPRRQRRVCLRRREGPRARGGPRGRALSRSQRGHRVFGGVHEQPPERRDARLRRPPGHLRARVLPRRARREMRHRSLGDPPEERRPRGRHDHDGTNPREIGGHRALLARGEAGLGRGQAQGASGGHRLRHQELGHRQWRRRAGARRAARRGRRHGRALQWFYRDGAGPLHRARPDRGRDHRAPALDIFGARRHRHALRVGTNHRLARHAFVRKCRREGRAPAPRGSRPGQRPRELGGENLFRRARRLRHHEHRVRFAASEDAHLVRLRGPRRRPRPRTGASRRSSRRTTSAAR